MIVVGYTDHEWKCDGREFDCLYDPHECEADQLDNCETVHSNGLHMA